MITVLTCLKIGTKTVIFKIYVTLSSLSLGVKLGAFSKGRQRAWPTNLMIMCYKKPVIFFIFDIYYAPWKIVKIYHVLH